jgi:hypothetical protein
LLIVSVTYVGGITFASRKCALTPVTKQAYFLYFGCKVGDQYHIWALHVCCMPCSSKVNALMNHKGCSMLFAVSIIWRELRNHLSDWCFCMLLPIQEGITKKKKWTVEYPDTPLAICPVPYCEGLPAYSRTLLQFFLDCDEEEESTPKGTQQPPTSRDRNFS